MHSSPVLRCLVGSLGSEILLVVTAGAAQTFHRISTSDRHSGCTESQFESVEPEKIVDFVVSLTLEVWSSVVEAVGNGPLPRSGNQHLVIKADSSAGQLSRELRGLVHPVLGSSVVEELTRNPSSKTIERGVRLGSFLGGT